MRRWPIYTISDLDNNQIFSSNSIYVFWYYLKNKLYFSMDFKDFKCYMKNKDRMILIPEYFKNGEADNYIVKRDYFFK